MKEVESPYGLLLIVKMNEKEITTYKFRVDTYKFRVTSCNIGGIVRFVSLLNGFKVFKS